MKKTCKNCKYSDYGENKSVFNCKVPCLRNRVFTYNDTKPCIHWEPKEASMNIKILKPISVKSVSEVCQEAGGKLTMWWFTNRSKCIVFDNEIGLPTIKLMPESYLDWLENKGFVEREVEFEPFQVPCKVNSVDALECLYDVKDSLMPIYIIKLIRTS